MDYATRLDELRLLRRMKAITAQEYKREKAKADKAEEKRLEAVRVQQLIEKQRREEEARKPRDILVSYSVAKDRVAWGNTLGVRVKRIITSLEDRKIEQESFLFRKRYNESTKRFRARATEEVMRRIRKANEDFRGDLEELGYDTYTELSLVGEPKLIEQPTARRVMRRAHPWHYEDSEYYTTVEEGNCVPETLKMLYPKFKDIEGEMTKLWGWQEGDGVSVEQVLQWCKYHDISCLGVDCEYNILVQNISKHRNHKSLNFVCKDAHMYLLKKEKAESIVKSRGNSKKVAKEVEAPIERTKVLLEFEEEIDWEAENTHFVVQSISEAMRLLHAYKERMNSIPKCQFGCRGQMVHLNSFVFGKNNKVSICPNLKVLEQASELTGEPVENLRSLSKKLAEEFLPEFKFSVLNQKVFRLLLQFKQGQHYAGLWEKERWAHIPGVEQAWDGNKQYTGCLRNSKHDWLFFDMFSVPRPYSGKPGNCLYFLETENTMPCKGNGLYSRVILEYLIAKGIPHTVKYEIAAASVLPADYFKEFVDTAVERFPDGFKYVINPFIGSFNTHETTSAKAHAFANQDEALEMCFRPGNPAHYWEYKGIHIAAQIKRTPLNTNNMPLYMQILDNAAIMLADAIEHIEARGGIVRSYNTDSITFKHAEKLQVSLPTCAIGGWKEEAVKEYKQPHKPRCRRETSTLTGIHWKTMVYEHEMKKQPWEVALEKSVYLEGAAGFGKSWQIRKLIEAVGEENCIVVGFTNIAANNIGGKTFHKLLRIGTESTKHLDLRGIFTGKLYLIIDEFSQVPSVFFQIAEAAKEAGLKICIAGDPKQILPIGESDGERVMNYLKSICENAVFMTNYKRGDNELLEALTCVRNRESIPFDREEKGELHFCFTKAMRDKINTRELAKHTGRSLRKTESGIPKVYQGMPLRSCITKENGNWLNGERWVVMNAGSSSTQRVRIQSLQRDLAHEIDDETLLSDFTAGYAMTIHSSQGLTITEDYTVHIQEKTFFDSDDMWRMIYTAVSRAKSKKQVGVVFH